MRRILQVFVLSMVVGLSLAGVASAAGSPSIATGAATKLSNTSAVLNGTVNPNGHATQYDFIYGPTTAYGATTVVHKVKSGTKAVAVQITVTGLTPGTTYHYRLNAINSAGAVGGADRSFTTSGHPPAAVVTGGAINVGKTVATPTGVINPEGATTHLDHPVRPHGGATGCRTSRARCPPWTRPCPCPLRSPGLPRARCSTTGSWPTTARASSPPAPMPPSSLSRHGDRRRG